VGVEGFSKTNLHMCKCLGHSCVYACVYMSHACVCMHVCVLIVCVPVLCVEGVVGRRGACFNVCLCACVPVPLMVLTNGGA